MNENQNVSIKYSDNKGNHITNIYAIRKRWEQETKEWQENLFNNLENKGVAYLRFAEYTLIK